MRHKMRYSNLEAEMKRQDITRGDLAKQLNLTPTTMSLKLNGKAKLTLAEAIHIKKIVKTDIPLEDLFHAS